MEIRGCYFREHAYRSIGRHVETDETLICIQGIPNKISALNRKSLYKLEVWGMHQFPTRKKPFLGALSRADNKLA
jgi:hypothetical protein